MRKKKWKIRLIMSVDPCHVTVLSAVKNVEIDFGRFNQRRRMNWICVQRTGGLSTLCQHANKTQTRGVDLSSRPCPGAYYSIRVRQPDRQLCGSASRGARRPEQVAFRVGSHGRDCAATASVTFKGHISSEHHRLAPNLISGKKHSHSHSIVINDVDEV